MKIWKKQEINIEYNENNWKDKKELEDKKIKKNAIMFRLPKSFKILENSTKIKNYYWKWPSLPINSWFMVITMIITGQTGYKYIIDKNPNI